jgi:hypothetical protein
MAVRKEHLWVTIDSENVMGKISAAKQRGVLVLEGGGRVADIPAF